MGEACTVDSFLARAAVETPGVRNLGWDLDREWVLVRTASETEIGDVCPAIARWFDAISTSEDNSGVRDLDVDGVPEATLGVGSTLEAGCGLAPILDAGRDADSILEAGRDAEARDADLDGDHGRDMSRRRDNDSSFSFCLSLKESLNASKKEGDGACVLGGCVADADFPEECI